VSPDVRDKSQLTSVHHAIGKERLDVVKALIKAGASINLEDTEGRRYTEYCHLWRSYKILIWLASKYPDLYINDETRETTLHFVAAQGLLETVKALVKRCVFHVDVRDDDEKTPLHYAAINGSDQVAEFLVNNGGDIDARERAGATPLHFAVRWGSEVIVKFILRKKGPDAKQCLESGDRLGRTPLHYAASQKTGLSYIVNLLKAGANIDARDNSGMTPLHLACRFGNISLVRMLLDEGAEKSLQDNQGMSPLDHATEKECHTITGMIKKSMNNRKEVANRKNC